MKALIYGVAILVGALSAVIGGAVAILAFLGWLPTASTELVKTSAGDLSLTTGNVALVVSFFGFVLIGYTLRQVGQLK